MSVGEWRALRARRLFGGQEWPFKMNAEKTGSTPTSASTAAIAAFILAGVSLIKVGINAVVPKRRCAATMVRIVSAVGASLNNTSPPPLT